MMTLETFQDSLSGGSAPPELTPVQRALWHDAKGDWAAAHEIAQSREGVRAYDRLHAYLHRKEGDLGNAGYWYRRAKAEPFTGSLEAEWTELVKASFH